MTAVDLRRLEDVAGRLRAGARGARWVEQAAIYIVMNQPTFLDCRALDRLTMPDERGDDHTGALFVRWLDLDFEVDALPVPLAERGALRIACDLIHRRPVAVARDTVDMTAPMQEVVLDAIRFAVLGRWT